jgi:hypothetical protein
MTPDSQDTALRNLLKEHGHVPVVRNPAFRAAVWARIEQRREVPATWRAWVRLHLAGFAMAALASVTVAAALGGWAGKARETALRETMLTRYVVSIDPHHQVASAAGAPVE